MTHANIPVDIGYDRRTASSTSTSPVTISVDRYRGERLVNAFATLDTSPPSVLDHSVEIGLNTDANPGIASVTFTAPDSDQRTFNVIVIGGALPVDQHTD
jgi:hypothetical protein